MSADGYVSAGFGRGTVPLNDTQAATGHAQAILAERALLVARQYRNAVDRDGDTLALDRALSTLEHAIEILDVHSVDADCHVPVGDGLCVDCGVGQDSADRCQECHGAAFHKYSCSGGDS